MARRSREEVIEYLTSKPWYSSFKKIVLKKNKIGVRSLVNETINLDDLIILAFKWNDTQEGDMFWYEVNRDYRIWLHSDE